MNVTIFGDSTVTKLHRQLPPSYNVVCCRGGRIDNVLRTLATRIPTTQHTPTQYVFF